MASLHQFLTCQHECSQDCQAQDVPNENILFGVIKCLSQVITKFDSVFAGSSPNENENVHSPNVPMFSTMFSFVKQRVEYLGHVVTPEGISPNPDKVRVVQEYPTPTNLKELRSFLGLANYYRRFVRGFSNIANRLNALTKKNVPFIWTVACTEAFNKLKRALVSAPILAYPNFQEPFLSLIHI